MSILRNSRLLTGASMATIFFVMATGSALAQTNRVLDEIVVTAQKKSQGLQETSLAIDALTGADLLKNGINSAAGLTDAVPALTIISGGGINGQVYMRGIGNRGATNYLDPAIILNYDGVALARGSATSIGAFYDINRIEVLKGPQGTLYGKNATGGVINIVPNKPEIGVREAGFAADFGNYSSQNFSAFANVPVGENSAFRVAASKVKHDGYNTDGTSDDDRKSFRAQFLTEINDSVSIRLAGDYTDIGGIGAGATPVGSYQRLGLGSFELVESGIALNSGPRSAESRAFRQTILAGPGFGFLNDIQDEWYQSGELWGLNAEIKFELGSGDLTILPGYRETSQDSRFGQPGFNSGWWQDESAQKSIEVNYAGHGSELFDYIIGAYYSDEDISGNNTFNQEFVLPMQEYTVENSSWAVFGEATFNINESTRAIVGARYTEDKKTMDGSIDNFITFCGGLGPSFVTPPGSFAHGCAVPGNLPHFPTLDTPEEAYAFLEDNGWSSTRIAIPPGFLIPLNNGIGQILHAQSTVHETISYNEPTYRATLEKDISENSMMFANYSHGYRAGGLEPTGNSYDPEFINAYTLGIKNTLLDGTLRLNAEAFWWDYKDQQISYFNLSDNGVLQNTTRNVGKATNRGIEVDVTWLVGDNTIVDGTVQYLDASYDELFFSSTTPRDNINCPSTIVGTTSSGSPDLLFDCSGNKSIFSPEWTIKAGIEHTFSLENSMQIVLGADTTYVSDQVGGFNNLEHENIDGYTTTNIDLTFEPLEGDWYFGLYARNLENKNRVRSTQNPLLGVAYVTVGADMTYGMRFGSKF
ncbi:MAG: TonB-dependent receptor [Robiginitomaculum sp.]|nr:MAG: TonB-dependent receptor [Robiginitomaculum sp.]